MIAKCDYCGLEKRVKNQIEAMRFMQDHMGSVHGRENYRAQMSQGHGSS